MYQDGSVMEYTDTDPRLPRFKSQHCLLQAVWYLWALPWAHPPWLASRDSSWTQPWKQRSCNVLLDAKFKLSTWSYVRQWSSSDSEHNPDAGHPMAGSGCPPGTCLSNDILDIKSDFLSLCSYSWNCVLWEKEQFGKDCGNVKRESQKHLEMTWFKNTKKHKLKTRVGSFPLCLPNWPIFLLGYVFLCYLELKYNPNWL